MACPEAPADEVGLILCAQTGDRTAFAALVRRYWEPVYRWLYRLTHDGHAAEDRTQETFLKALSALASFAAGTNFKAWVFRIAHNNWANQKRAGAKVRQAFPADLAAEGDDPPELAMSR